MVEQQLLKLQVAGSTPAWTSLWTSRESDSTVKAGSKVRPAPQTSRDAGNLFRHRDNARRLRSAGWIPARQTKRHVPDARMGARTGHEPDVPDARLKPRSACLPWKAARAALRPVFKNVAWAREPMILNLILENNMGW